MFAVRWVMYRSPTCISVVFCFSQDAASPPMEQVVGDAAGTAPMDAGPETAEQPVPPVGDLLEGDVGVSAVDTDVVEGETNAGDAVLTSVESAGADAGQLAVEATNEPDSGATPPLEADTTTPDVSIDLAAPLESSRVAGLGDLQPDSGDAPLDAGLPAEAEQPLPTTEGDEVVPMGDSGAVGEANAGDAVLSSAESVNIDQEQPAVEVANEPDGDTAPVEADTTTPTVNIDTPESLESSSGVADLRDVQSASGDVPIDAGPETEVKQPASAADAPAEGGEVGPSMDLDAVGEANIDDVKRMPAESAEAGAGQPAVDTANEISVDDTPPPEADTTTPAVSIDTPESLKISWVADLDDVQSTVGDVPIDAGPEAEAKQPALAAEGHEVVLAVDPDAVGEASGDMKPTSAESAHVDTEQPAVEAANEPGANTPPSETNPVTRSVSIDPDTSLESINVADLGDVQPTPGDAPIDAGLEAEENQPTPAVEDDELVTVANPGAVGEANAGEAFPPAVESAGIDAGQPAVDTANEISVDDTPPAEADTTTPAVSIDTPESLESSSGVAKLGDVQPDSGDKPLDAGPEAEAAQPASADVVVPVVDPDAVGEASPGDVVPKSAEPLKVDAEQLAGEAANKTDRHEATSAVADTATPDDGMASATSLESTKVTDLGDVHADSDDVPIDAGRKAEAEQPAPAVEALADGDAAMPAADPDAVGEANAGEAIPTPAETAGLDAEQLVVVADSDKVLAEAIPVTAAVSMDTDGSSAGQVAEPGEIQPSK